MRTLDSSIVAELVKDEHGFTVVYEIDVDPPSDVIRFGSREITWNGVDYAGMALVSSELDERMEFHVPELKLTASNVDEFWRDYLEPVDVLQGKRIRQRLLVYNPGTDQPKAASSILFSGDVEKAEQITDERVALRCVGKLAGLNARIPGRRTSLWCPARFADGVDCNYVSTTVAANSGSSSTALIVNAGTYLEDGQTIRVGSGSPVAIAAGGGTVNITLAEPRTWSSSDPVAYTSCSRSFHDCQMRQREHEFLGFLGVDSVARQSVLISAQTWLAQYQAFESRFRPGRALTLFEMDDLPLGEVRPLANARAVVPVVFGRLLTRGTIVEDTVTRWPGSPDYPLHRVQWRVLSEGEVDSIAHALYDGAPAADEQDSGGNKSFGFWLRPGTLGVDVVEASYPFGTQVLAQRIDASFLSTVAGAALSRTAVALFVQKHGDGAGSVDALFDVLGVQCEIYDAAGVPQGRAWTELGVWHLIELLTNARWGLGKRISAAELDHAVHDATAAYCGTLIAGPATTIRAEPASNPSSVYEVVDALGFKRGMALELEGTSAGTVTEVLGRHTIVTDTARTQAVDDALTSEVPRFSTNGVLNRVQNAAYWIEALLGSFGGYITMDGELVQIRVERDEASAAAHFGDTGYDQGYGILGGTFRWLVEERDLETNMVSARFRNASTDLGEDEVSAADWDHIFDHQLAEASPLELDMVDDRYQAQRIAQLRLDKTRRLGTGARFDGQPIAIALQPGDVIQVTHAIPGWSGAYKRVTGKRTYGLGKDRELCVQLTVEDYDASLYADAAVPPAPFVPAPQAPTITLQALAVDKRAVLSWQTDGVRTPIRSYQLHRGVGGDPSSRNAELVWQGAATQHTYEVPDSELGQTLHFQVTALAVPIRVSSAVVQVVTSSSDPVDASGPFYNLLVGGRFPGTTDAAGNHPLWVIATKGTGAITPVYGNAHVVDDDAGARPWTDAANVLDGDPDTYAESSLIGVQTEVGIEVHFAAGTKTGRAVAKVQRNFGLYPHSNLIADYSLDGGSSWIQIGNVGASQGALTFKSATLIDVDMSLLIVRARVGGSGVGSFQGRYYEGYFEEDTLTPPWARINNGVCTFRGDGTNYAVIERPVPGAQPSQNETLFAANDPAVLFVQARAPEGSADEDMEVWLVDKVTAEEWLLGSVPSEELADWDAWAFRFLAPEELSGNLWVQLRTKYDGLTDVAAVGLYAGEAVPDKWYPAVSELEDSRWGDRRIGRPVGFDRGQWGTKPGTPPRRRSAIVDATL